MEYLQYFEGFVDGSSATASSFKPCYKWNTFNTLKHSHMRMMVFFVLNLVISGIPSIQSKNGRNSWEYRSFKPCYKWNTFNTKDLQEEIQKVLDSFKPCYKWNTFNTSKQQSKSIRLGRKVLNLVISGIPSIRELENAIRSVELQRVLNLVISGIPSIHGNISQKLNITL